MISLESCCEYDGRLWLTCFCMGGMGGKPGMLIMVRVRNLLYHLAYIVFLCGNSHYKLYLTESHVTCKLYSKNCSFSLSKYRESATWFYNSAKSIVIGVGERLRSVRLRSLCRVRARIEPLTLRKRQSMSSQSKLSDV